MATDYSRTLLRVAVAQICQSLGWNAVQSTPMELLTDVMERYLQEVGKCAHRYSEQFGRTEPNLDSVALAFQDLGISVPELEDYAQHVEPVPFALDIPKFPAARDPLLFFPKPNSRELLNRDEHIHEHLPPMHPEWDEEIQPRSPVPPPSMAGASLAPPEESKTQQSPQAGTVSGEKRPATSPADVAPAAKKLKNLPDEAGHSQYMVKRVGMSSSGILIGTPGILPDARTPPPPTPQTPKPVMVPFPNTENETNVSASPKVLKPSVISETVEERTSIGGVNTDNISSIRAEHIDKMPLPKSPRGGKVPPKSPRPGPKSPKVAKKSPKSPKVSPRLPKGAGKSPKAAGGKSPKAGKSPKGTLKATKVPKSPKVKKIKTPKPGKPPKGSGISSPLLGKSPKTVKDKDSVGVVKTPKVQRSPKSPGRGKAKSPRKNMAPKEEEKVIVPEPLDTVTAQAPPPSNNKEALLPLKMWCPSPQGQVLDLSKPKPVLEIPTKGAMKEMDPRIMEQHGFQSLPSKPAETMEEIEHRLASYEDAIDTVVQMTTPEDPPLTMESPQHEEEVHPEQVLYTPDVVRCEKIEKTKAKSDKKGKKAKREADITDTIDKVIAGHDNPASLSPHPLPTVLGTKTPDVYAFPSVDEAVTKSPATFPSPVSTPKSDKRKEKKPKDKKSKLVIKVPESASTPNREESDASKDRPRSQRESSFSPSTPQVAEQMTPGSIRRFSYSPEKKFAPSPKVSTEPAVPEVVIKPPINPIKLDISQSKISIKIPKDNTPKSDKEPKKEKKKKKNKEKDRDREKTKDKKDKHRDKEKKKEKKDKGKKEKRKEESTTTVGGQGFPKLTLKFGGLKTATPTMSGAIPREPTPPPQKPEKLKLVIKPGKPDSATKPAKHKAKPSAPSPVPTPQKARTPSPVPPPPVPPAYTSSSPSLRSPSPSLSPSPDHQQASPSPSPSPLPRERSSSPAPSTTTVHSPSRSRSHSPMPVLHHQSPLSLSPAITFSPLPSPGPHIELPISRSPTRSPSPRPPVMDYQPPRAADMSDKEASPGKQSPEDEDDDEEAGSSSTRMIISETVGTIKDENGETIWICPACKHPDDGSPMIGCDKCDDWYHWPCVNIKKEPPEEDKWYCPRCRQLTGKPDKKPRKPVKAKPGRKKTKKK